jgi:hypothetical protein
MTLLDTTGRRPEREAFIQPTRYVVFDVNGEVLQTFYSSRALRTALADASLVLKPGDVIACLRRVP